MASEFFVTITGEQQGKFPGEVTTKGREGTIGAFKFLYEVGVPSDVSTGHATGKPQHQPVRITKRWDVSSLWIFRALVRNENLTEVTFQFWRTSKGGVEDLYQTIKVTDARVVNLKWYTDPDALGTIDAPELEDVSFAFQGITVENVDGTSAGDEFVS